MANRISKTLFHNVYYQTVERAVQVLPTEPAGLRGRTRGGNGPIARSYIAGTCITDAHSEKQEEIFICGDTWWLLSPEAAERLAIEDLVSRRRYGF